MAYIYPMSNYKPFYIQTTNDTSAHDTTEWGLIAKTNPYVALPDPKDCYKNDWKDEDGDDEYNAQIHYKAFTFDVKFIVKTFDTQSDTAEKVMRGQLDTFFAKIKQGEFKIYDAFNGLGRQKVRYAGYKQDDFRRCDNWARSIFTITFKVNDPITRMKLNNGSIVTA